jgi:uncharacterized membrane protein YhaH (DUF805 family)
MTFTQAIAQCFSHYADFSGRARRAEYWWFMLFIFLTELVIGFFSDVLSGIFSLAVVLPYTAVAARRLHDMGRSGWWQFIWLIPLIGWAIAIYWLVQPSGDDNQFGLASDAAPSTSH